MRSERDKRLDAALLLYVLDNSGAIRGRGKLQKTIFLIEFKLKQSGLIGPHYRFFRYLAGPYSQQINEDVEELAHKGFIARKKLTLLERGRFLVDLIIPALRDVPENRRPFEIIDEGLQWSRPRRTETLLRHVCALEVFPDEDPRKRMKTRDVPRFWDIIVPSGNGMQMTSNLDQLLKDELTLTGKELRDAEQRLREIDLRMFKNLAGAIKSDDRPSAQTLPG